MPASRKRLFAFLDVIGLFLAFIATSWIAPVLDRELTAGGRLSGAWVHYLYPPRSIGSFPPLSEYAWVFLLVALATIACMDISGGYAPIRQQSIPKIIVVGIAGPLTGVALLSTILFALKTPLYSRVFVFAFGGIASFALIGCRFIGRGWYEYLRRQGFFAEAVAIIGTPNTARIVVEQLMETVSPAEYTLAGYFSLTAGTAPIPTAAGGELPCLGHVENLDEALIHEPVQRIIMVPPANDGHWLTNAIGVCDYFRVTAHIIPESLLSARLSDLIAGSSDAPGLLPAITLAPLETRADWLVIKRLIDVVVSGALLILLSPLFLLIAIAIKLTTPRLTVFYPWRVVGFCGRRFTGYKFTTMVQDADAQKDSLAALNEMSGPVFKITNDPRVTPLGKILRKYSLNELPQLWSVLKGDMSLVGPRPAGPHELRRYQLWHKRKLSAQPGITCFWQVRGRNKISNFDEWVRMDLEYIRNRSLLLDFKILARTAWVVVRGTGC